MIAQGLEIFRLLKFEGRRDMSARFRIWIELL